MSRSRQQEQKQRAAAAARAVALHQDEEQDDGIFNVDEWEAGNAMRQDKRGGEGNGGNHNNVYSSKHTRMRTSATRKAN